MSDDLFDDWYASLPSMDDGGITVDRLDSVERTRQSIARQKSIEGREARVARFEDPGVCLHCGVNHSKEESWSIVAPFLDKDGNLSWSVALGQMGRGRGTLSAGTRGAEPDSAAVDPIEPIRSTAALHPLQRSQAPVSLTPDSGKRDSLPHRPEAM